MDRWGVASWTEVTPDRPASRLLNWGMTSIARVVTERRLEDPDEPWRYWVTRPVSERIEAVEKL